MHPSHNLHTQSTRGSNAVKLNKYFELKKLLLPIFTNQSLKIKRDKIPLTARLHKAPQQLDAMFLLSGNALKADNKSWTPP